MKNYKGWSGGFPPIFTDDTEFQTFLSHLNYTETYWFSMNVDSAAPIGLPKDRYLIFVNITNATRGYLLAYPHTGTKIYRRALTGNGWQAWTVVNEVSAADLEALKPIRLTIRLNDLVPDTSISGYNYKKTVTVPGITADYYGYAWMEYGNYQLPFIVETGTNSVTLYLQIAPSNTTRIVVVLTNTKEVS